MNNNVRFDGGDVVIRRRPDGFQQKLAEPGSKGIVFRGWKRYEEAEEEE